MKTVVLKTFPKKTVLHTENLWFTSDTHWGHKNIMKFCPRTRQYESLAEMERSLTDNWNRRVNKDDLIFHLGDLSFYHNLDKTKEVLRSLNGRIILVLGNHDDLVAEHANELVSEGLLQAVYQYIEVKVDGQPIVMCHFPIASWNKAHHGAWNLHGHCHGGYPPVGKQLDVGSDSYLNKEHGCEVFSYEEIAEYMKSRNFVAVDDHRETRNHET